MNEDVICIESVLVDPEGFGFGIVSSNSIAWTIGFRKLFYGVAHVFVVWANEIVVRREDEISAIFSERVTMFDDDIVANFASNNV